jgi:hypothetical protein
MFMSPIEAAVLKSPHGNTRGKNSPLKCLAGICVLLLLVPYLAARILIDGLRLSATAVYRGLCSVGELGLQELSAGASRHDR